MAGERLLLFFTETLHLSVIMELTNPSRDQKQTERSKRMGVCCLIISCQLIHVIFYSWHGLVDIYCYRDLMIHICHG